MFKHSDVHINVNLGEMEFRKDTQTLVLVLNMRNSARFPDHISVHSEHTGRVVEFVQDHEKAEANEFWDGELMEYIPTEHLPKVNRIVAVPYF
jgi:hypothetical protein